MRLPSTKTLRAAFPDLTPADAKLLRLILRGDARPDQYPDRFPATMAWIRDCYNRPSAGELSMSAANELLGGHGAEAVFSDGATWPWLEYVNMGDAYTTTLCRVDGRYIVSSWGDEVERRECNGSKQ